MTLLHATWPRPSLAGALVEGAAGRLFAATWGSLVLVDLARHHDAMALASVAALGAVLAVHQPPAAAIAVGAIGWLYVTGFVANTDGLLAVSGPADVVRLVLLVGVALTVALTTRRGTR